MSSLAKGPIDVVKQYLLFFLCVLCLLQTFMSKPLNPMLQGVEEN